MQGSRNNGFLLVNIFTMIGYQKKKSVFLNKIRFLAHFLVGNPLTSYPLTITLNLKTSTQVVASTGEETVQS